MARRPSHVLTAATHHGPPLAGLPAYLLAPRPTARCCSRSGLKRRSQSRSQRTDVIQEAKCDSNDAPITTGYRIDGFVYVDRRVGIFNVGQYFEHYRNQSNLSI